MKKNIGLISKAAFVVLAIVLCFIAYFVYGQRKNDAQKAGLDEAKSLVLLNVGAINSAISNSDDIKLFSILESLSKTNNIVLSFIVDKEGKVVLSADMSRKADIDTQKYKAGLDKTQPFVQKADEKDNFIYYFPAVANHKIIALISTQKNLQGVQNWLTIYLAFALIIAFVFAAGLFFALKKFILVPFEKTKSDFEQGRLDSGSDEISNILMRERKKSEKTVNLLKTNETSLTGLLSNFCQEKLADFAFIAVLNSLNNIVYAGGTADGLLKDGAIGKNIVEATSDTAVLDAISKANEEPKVEIQISINGINLSIVSLSENGVLLGTIITAPKSK
ncbi:MAG: hypothetical protein LBB93_03190 [Elusimicrobiota bacterium]|jgi:hypothetical protein|nr:hypothetical protein [Elusimicrobiota bacterium]